MHSIKKTILLFLFTLSGFLSWSQSAKSFYKAGNKNLKTNDFQSAFTNYTKALELKPGKYSYILAHAVAAEKLKKYPEAIRDYQQLLSQKPKAEHYIKVADLYVLLENYKDALASLTKLLSEEKYNIDGLQKSAYCNIMLKDFKGAEQNCNTAIEKNDYNHRTHYLRALALDSMKNYKNAVADYLRAISLMKTLGDNQPLARPEFKPYYTNLAYAQYHKQEYDDAITDYSIALDIVKVDTVEPKNFLVYFQRGLCYLEKTDYNEAIGDMSKSLALNKHIPTFFHRGLIFKKTSQFQSAISDFSSVLVSDNKYADAYRERGICYLELNNYKDAISDFNHCLKLKPYDSEAKSLLKMSNEKNYQANKEDVAPQLRIIYPLIDNNNFINIYFNQINLLVEGQVTDKSSIKSITVNGKAAVYDKTELNPLFACKLPLYDVKTLEIEVLDIYENKTTKSIKLGRIIDNAKLKVAFSGTLVADDGNLSPYANRSVNITNEKGEILYSTRTDANGRFKFEKLPYDKSYLIAIDVEDTPLSSVKKFIILDENKKPVLYAEADGKGKIMFPLLQADRNAMSLMKVEDEPLLLDIKGKLLAADEQKTPLANIALVLIGSHGEIIKTQKTTAEGLFVFSSLLPGIDYTFRIFEGDVKNIPFDKIYITDEKGRIVKEIKKDDLGFFKFELLPGEKQLLTSIAVEDVDPWMGTFKLNATKNELSIIEDIHYESGSWKILPEAEAVLNKAIEALNANPKLMLEVQAHTDAVAGDDFNMELSQKRAATVVDYIVAKGIDKKRLTAAGFGETQLTNRCANGVDCSDAEHKQNRRTVFKVSYPDKK